MQKLAHTTENVYAIIAELSGNDEHIISFYADLIDLYERFVPALFTEFPELNGESVNLHALYQQVKGAGGISSVERLSEKEQSHLLDVSPQDLQSIISIYIQYILLYEAAELRGCIEEEEIEAACEAFKEQNRGQTPQDLPETSNISHLEYQSMHIPARRLERPAEELSSIRELHYNSLPFGCLPVVQSSKFGVETATGNLNYVRSQQDNIICAIEQEKDVDKLCNYLLEYSVQFFRTRKIQFLLEQLESGADIGQFVQITDSLSHVADMFIVDDSCRLLGKFPLYDIIECIISRIPEFPELLQVLLRLLAKLQRGAKRGSALHILSREAFVGCQESQSLQETEKEQCWTFILNFILYFVRGAGPAEESDSADEAEGGDEDAEGVEDCQIVQTTQTLYTFGAAVFLARCILAEGHGEQFVYVLLEAAQRLIGRENEIQRIAFDNLFEVLKELCDSERYDAVLVFLFENAPKLTSEEKKRLAFIQE